VHCLHWEKQLGNCSYSPFGCLCTVVAEKNSRETAVILRLALCALSSLRKTVRKLRLFSIWFSVHCIHRDKSQETAVILRLAVCALSSLRKTVGKLRLFSVWLSVHCLHWEKQSGNCGYSPFGCLCTVFTEKNGKETAVILHLAVCALSSLRKNSQETAVILHLVLYALSSRRKK
jgi:diacylglycerol kinase